MITRKRLVLRKKDDDHAPQLLGLATASMMKYRACCATTAQMADRPTSRTYAVSANMMRASDTKPACACNHDKYQGAMVLFDRVQAQQRQAVQRGSLST